MLEHRTSNLTGLLLPALLDRQRRLLHDRWTGTRVIRLV